MIDIHKNLPAIEAEDSALQLDAQAEAIADEILGELDLTAERDTVMPETSFAICVGHANGDLLSETEMDLEKVARLRRLVRAGQSRIDTPRLASAMLASGDLS